MCASAISADKMCIVRNIGAGKSEGLDSPRAASPITLHGHRRPRLYRGRILIP
jgi:hypothetical protein